MKSMIAEYDSSGSSEPSLVSPFPQNQSAMGIPTRGQTAPDSIAPGIIRALKLLHHGKVTVQGGEKLFFFVFLFCLFFVFFFVVFFLKFFLGVNPHIHTHIRFFVLG